MTFLHLFHFCNYNCHHPHHHCHIHHPHHRHHPYIIILIVIILIIATVFTLEMVSPLLTVVIVPKSPRRAPPFSTLSTFRHCCWCRHCSKRTCSFIIHREREHFSQSRRQTRKGERSTTPISLKLYVYCQTVVILKTIQLKGSQSVIYCIYQ